MDGCFPYAPASISIMVGAAKHFRESLSASAVGQAFTFHSLFMRFSLTLPYLGSVI